MPLAPLCAFLFLGASFLSLWIRPKLWGILLGFSMLFGLVAGNIHWIGLIFIGILLLLWKLYNRKPHFALFILLICVSASFKLHLLPGYTSLFFTPQFAIRLEGALIGLFPLALLVPLAQTTKDWMSVLKGVLIGCIGIGVLAIAAILSGAAHWHLKLPSFAAARILSNLFLTSIPEEGFYRGFIQNTLCKYFECTKFGKTAALLLTSILFAAAHIYWAPRFETLLFVFLASLLYGSVYLISGKIESAISCHFLLNFIHMTFFSYHAM